MGRKEFINYDHDVHDFLTNYFSKDTVTVTFEYDHYDVPGGSMSKCHKVTFEHIEYFRKSDIEAFAKYFKIIEINYNSILNMQTIDKFSIDPGDSFKLIKDYFNS